MSAAAPPLRVLFLAFEFPPLATGGVHRAIAFAELLPRHAIELDVVTVRPDDYAVWSSSSLDPALTARIPSSVRVHRIPSGFPAWYWRLSRSKLGFRAAQYAHWGDPLSVFWRRALFDTVDRLVAERRPDVLLATMPPFGVAVLARAIARRHRLPWVADWRDPWTLWRAAPFPTYAHYRYARAAEGAALRDANASVATSPVTRDDWLRYFPSAAPSRLVTIYNGYDAEVLDAIPAPPVPPDVRTIAYVGSFYYDPAARSAALRPAWRRAPHRWLFYTPRREDWLYRSPWFFLRGLARFAERWPHLASRLRVEFAGAVPSWLPAMLAETGTAALVTLHGPVAHADAIRLQRRADALLLTSAKVDGARDYSIAGKTFEYLGLRRPILAVVTDGAMRDLVEQSGLGLFADPDDTDGVAGAIARIVDDPSSLPRPNEAFIASCERHHAARRMADVLRAAAAEGYRG